METGPSEKDLVASLCRKSLKHFIREGWHVLEPETPLIWNWHLDVIADHIQAMLEGPKRKGPWTQNLIINVPPGTMKSLITSVFAPAWKWLHNPNWKAVFASANPRVSLRDSMRCKDLLTSSWYRETFAPKWGLSDEQNAKSLYYTTKGGFRSSISVNASVTGDRVDAIFIDDPLDASDANSEPIRTTANLWLSQSLRNRLANMITGTRVMIMQRLHEEDPSGYFLDPAKDGQWDLLAIPMLAEEESRKPTFLGWVDNRKPGELLMPARFPKEVIDQERITLGPSAFAGQMQQRPAPVGGDLFKREWWNFYRDPKDPWKSYGPRPRGARTDKAIPLPEKFDAIWQSWDMTFKDGEKNDFVVGVTIGIKGAYRFVLDRCRKRMGFTETKRETKRLAEKYRPTGILVESAANGPAVINSLAEDISGIVEVKPEGGKESRAANLEPKVANGNWVLPEDAPWLEEWFTEFGNFPRGKHDDMVDACSQLEVHLTDSSYAKLLALCKK